VSVSPWNDYRRVFDGLGGDYVASVKPNPAIFLDAQWSEAAARAAIDEALDLAAQRGVAVELIMKDISTVARNPRRLWDWARIAAEAARKSR